MVDVRTFPRSEDGSINAPMASFEVAAIFSPDISVGAFRHMLTVIDEDTAVRMTDLAEDLAKLTIPMLRGVLCEGWGSDRPLGEVIRILRELDGRITLRAVLAQRFIHANPSCANLVTPFYLRVCGVKCAPKASS